jgi:hypothetical protein
MIKTPTTFIVGAGASCDHGLPAGEALRALAVGLQFSDAAYQFLLQSGLDPKVIRNVLAELRADTTAPSIDAFLTPRQHRSDVMEVGRALIAILLGAAMGSCDINRGSAWVDYIFRRMRDGARTCREFVAGNSSVRFRDFQFRHIHRGSAPRSCANGFFLMPQMAISMRHDTHWK